MKVYAFLLALYCALIFCLSHQPSLPSPMMFMHQDKLIHASAYAIMGLLAWRTFVHLPQKIATVAWVTILFCSFYGFTDELHQSFIDGRDADVWDWLADTLGASLMVSFLLWRRHKI